MYKKVRCRYNYFITVLKVFYLYIEVATNAIGINVSRSGVTKLKDCRH